VAEVRINDVADLSSTAHNQIERGERDENLHRPTRKGRLHSERRKNMNTRVLVAAALAGFALAAPAALADNPTSGFATQDTGCLGGLRSAIARGDLAGVVLSDGFVVPAGFNGDFNPGGHTGTVDEAAFLQSHGITDLSAFCALFASH
jgi:hypothetical protein